MNIEELQVKGSALVTAIDDCPEIAGSSQPAALARELGPVVTARFCTREVHTVARVEILSSNGRIETLEGTPIHPIWSIDRNDWVPLGELAEGETLQASGGIATVLSLALVTCSLPVYNIEVHGEHVYQVGELGVLVHNACEGVYEFVTTSGLRYVGQSKDVFRRLAEHVRMKRLSNIASATVYPVSGGKTARELFELGRINALGGINPLTLANKVLPISAERLANFLKTLEGLL